MEYEKIKQLIDEMGNSKLTEVDIEFPDGTKISMKKDNVKERVIQEIQDTTVIKNSDNITKETKKEEKRKYNKITNGWNFLFKTFSYSRTLY